jgi:hypothetical protein
MYIWSDGGIGPRGSGDATSRESDLEAMLEMVRMPSAANGWMRLGTEGTGGDAGGDQSATAVDAGLRHRYSIGGHGRGGPCNALQYYPTMGIPLTLKYLTVVVLGGVGSLLGSVFGGMVLGLSEALTSLYIGPEWAPTVAFIVLIVVLVTRPQGLFGMRRP